MRLSKASCIWRLNIGRLASTGRKKVTNMLICFLYWHGMVHVDEGHKLLERTLDLLSAARPLIKNGDKLDCQNWVIFIHKSKQDAVPSTSPAGYYGTILTWHIRMILWTFWPCQIVDRPEMTRYCCMCLPLPHQDKDSYHSGEESFANIRFG